jgi:hypothetical protein
MKNFLLIAVFALTACATNITPQATGGSKADGTVTLSYEYGVFEKPVVDWSVAGATAKQRCKAWHYKNAEAFGGAQTRCLAADGYGGCTRTQVNVTYQCTDN